MSEKVRRQPQTGYRPSLGTRIAKRLRGKKVNRGIADNIFSALFLLIMGAFMALPLIYVILNAFKPMEELLLFPPRFLVYNPTLSNFSDLFTLMGETWVPFSRYVANTVFITATATFFHIAFSSMAAYALSKHTFFGSRVLFQLVVVALMFNGTVTAVPNYLLMSDLHWIDTCLSVIVPAIQAPLGLYLMKQFMEPIPDSILESARMDGAREFRVMWSIVMPQVKPAWLTLIILQIQSLWGMSSTYLISEQNKTLAMAMQQIVSGGIARMGAAGAVSVVMMAVPILTFILSQSQVIETMSTSGMKE
ncbi:MAG: carbohydrate ABC transporter permease [Acutalibacteraceae bacterium]